MEDLNSMGMFVTLNGAINHTGHPMCQIQNILSVSTCCKNAPLLLTSLSFLQQEYLQAALQDNDTQLPQAKSLVALTNAVLLSRRNYVLTLKLNTSYSSHARQETEKSKRGGKKEVWGGKLNGRDSH